MKYFGKTILIVFFFGLTLLFLFGFNKTAYAEGEDGFYCDGTGRYGTYPDGSTAFIENCADKGTGWTCSGEWPNGGCVQTSAPSPTPTPYAQAACTTNPNGYYGCATWVTDNCPDKTRVCITADGKAGVLCHITCTSCGSGSGTSGNYFKQGSCSGPTSANSYCDSWGSGQMCSSSGSPGAAVSSCTWEACTPANTTTPGNCTITPTISSACTNCILGVKNQGKGDLLNNIKGFNHELFDPCSAESIVSYWCNGQLSAGAKAECDSIKSGTCASACGSSASTPPSAPPSSSSPSAPPGSAAPSSAPAVTTTHYRIAENSIDLNTAVWQEYKSAPTLLDFEFSDKTPGVKSVFVEFKDSTGKEGGCGVDDSQPCNVQIQLLGEDPKINSCSLSFEGNNTILNLKGENFGSGKGTVKSGNTTFTAEQIRLWKNDSVQAVWPNAPSGEALPVLLTNTDGQQGEGQCSAISQLSVGAKFFCGGPPPATVSNVDLVLAGVFEGGKVLKQKVSIDTTGVIQGLSQKLEEDKDYKLSLKAPRSLRKSASFTAGPGSTNVSNFTLPLGDIFPAKNADGKINTFDYGELVRQLIISRDASNRSADFNADSRVNSIDWACMRHDFNKEDDPEPVAGSLPSPSPSPNVSPSPGASVSPSPSPSPSSSPAP